MNLSNQTCLNIGLGTILHDLPNDTAEILRELDLDIAAPFDDDTYKLLVGCSELVSRGSVG